MQGQFVSHNFLQSFWIPFVIRITPNGKANYLNIGIPIDPADSNVNFWLYCHLPGNNTN